MARVTNLSTTKRCTPTPYAPFLIPLAPRVNLVSVLLEHGFGSPFKPMNTMKNTTLFASLICAAFLLGGCGIKGLVDTFRPMNESQAIVTLSDMLPQKEVSALVVEWTKTDPKVDAPNSLTYDNYSFSLTHKTPDGTIVYGPVKREVLKKLAERAQAGEAVKVFDVTKNGAKVISRNKKTER
jgi:hypothetical protein